MARTRNRGFFPALPFRHRRLQHRPAGVAVVVVAAVAGAGLPLEQLQQARGAELAAGQEVQHPAVPLPGAAVVGPRLEVVVAAAVELPPRHRHLGRLWTSD